MGALVAIAFMMFGAAAYVAENPPKEKPKVEHHEKEKPSRGCHCE